MRLFLTTAILLAILPLLLACGNAAEVPPSLPTATPWPTATATPWPALAALFPEPTATATPGPTATATPGPALATLFPEPTATATPWPTATVTPGPDPAALAALFPEPVPYDSATASPAQTPVGLILNEPESFPGYTLLRPNRGQNIYLIDNQGRVVHQWPLDRSYRFARLLENGNLLTSARGQVTDNIREIEIREIDPTGRVIWEYTAPDQHHDLLKMPNGNVLLLLKSWKHGGEVRGRGGNPESTGRYLELDYIIEVRPTGPDSGEIVWEWSVWDHLIQDFDPSLPNYGTVAEHPELVDINYRLRLDWLHANSIDYNAELDQIALSARNYGELWIIDHSTTTAEAAGHSGGNGGRGGDLLYRWGNPAAYQAGTAADQQLFRPHNVHWIEPGLPGAGNLLLFNNGDEADGKARQYSSIDEIAPPREGSNYRLAAGKPAAPARPVWTYTTPEPEDWYSPRQSGVQRLPNGNTLICSSRTGTIFEVTPAGKVVWGYINPSLPSGPLSSGAPMPLHKNRSLASGWESWDNMVYRAYRYAPDYPGLQYLDLTPGDPIERDAAP